MIWFDYTVATILDIVSGLLPFIAIGSYGADFLQGGSFWGFILALCQAAPSVSFLVTLLILGATYYRQRSSPSR